MGQLSPSWAVVHSPTAFNEDGPRSNAPGRQVFYSSGLNRVLAGGGAIAGVGRGLKSDGRGGRSAMGGVTT